MKQGLQKLTDSEIQLVLDRYPEWKLELANGLHSFCFEKKFSSFSSAFSFLTKLALVSESLDHHAEIWNSYDLVRLKLYTHDQNGLTKNDEAFIERLMKFD
ncbi:4a-hydroxytetrahydrobiopterin dehydratase [Leptospira jelokensis]|uniref:4a-hydroxytetrahydrobiopterin dehydratase n=1 Tax=Leptospira jelokensis TaxID=2484931 RepID=UPI0010911DF4|nr:4a-hydroxytetrahydrobiopterin dehydratase [Leptospira jelokensis]TGM01338.1 4a-hydroxytetrahydrobiopterin dehydratase [Leptospira jelokensis]